MGKIFELTKKTVFSVIIFATIISSIFFIFGYYYFEKQEKKTIDQRKKELESITIATANVIEDWYNGMIFDSRLLSENFDFNNKLNSYIQNQPQSNKQILMKKMLEIKDTKFEEIFLYDFKSNLLVSTQSALENLKLNQIMKNKLISNEVFSTGFYYCNECEKFHLDFIVPKVINEKTYFVVFRTNVPQYLLNTFQFTKNKYTSLDINLAIKDNDSVRVITQTKFAKKKVVYHYEDTNHGIVLASNGYTGFVDKFNFNNEKILGYVTQIPIMNIAIASRISIDDIYSSFTSDVKILLLILLFFIFVISSLLIFLYSRRQKLLYQNLWLSEQEHFITLNSIGDAVITTDTVGKVTYLNPVAENLTGWKNSEAINKNVEDVFVIINEFSREKVISPIEIVLTEGVVVGLANHTILISKNGTEIPIADSGAPIKDKSGNIKGVVLVFRDQTEERQHSNLLEQSVSRLVRAEEVSKTGNWELHLDERKIWGSQEALKIYELDENPMDYEIAKKNPLSEYREMLDIAMQNLIQKGEEYNLEFKIKGHKSGIIKDIHNIAVFDKEQNIIFGVIQDITERKRAENILRETEQKFETIFNNTNEAIFIHRLEGNIIDVNNSALKMYGYEIKAEILVKSVEELSDAENNYNNVAAKKQMDKAIETGKSTFEWRAKRKDGTIFWAEVQLIKVKINNTEYILAVVKDIDERKIAEVNLIKEKEKAQNYLEIAPIIFVAIDRNQNISLINNKGLEILGYGEDELIGQNWFDKCLPEEFRENTKSVFAELIDGKYINVEYNENTIIAKNGEKHLIAWHNILLKDNFGKISGSLSSGIDITEKRKAELALMESEKTYRLITENTADVITLVDFSLNINYVSPSIIKLLGYTSDEFINLTPDKYLTEEGLEYVKKSILEEIQDEYENGPFWDKYRLIEIQEKTKSGNLIWVEIKASFVRDEKGNPKSIIVVTRNIEERRKFLEDIKDSESRNQELASATFEAIFFSVNGICTDQNKTAKKMFGFTLEEAIGQPATNWIHPEYRAMVRENMITDNEEPYEAVALRKDGTTFPCEIQGRVVYTEKGKVRITALRDITAKKIAEQKMKESNEQFKLLFEYSPLGIYIADTEGNIIDANQTLIAMFGSPSLEATKQINVLTFPPLVNNGYAGYFIDARDNNRIVLLEMDYTTKWGKQLSLSSYIVPLANEFGEVYSIFTIVDDITDRKNAENEILIAKNKAEESDLLKSAFLANMSHEIRTPMNAIIGFSKFLEDDNLDKDERVEFLGIINQKGADLLKLIDDILDLSKIEANQLILFYATSDVYSVVYEIVNSYNKSIKIQEYHYDKKVDVIIGNTEPEFIECSTDFNRLKQILNNLISNAMKFTEEGYIEVGYQLLLDKIEFYVKDTGIGIANENFDKIFQRFRQGDDFYQSRKYGGTGLGLSIVSGLVQALGGKIWVESEIGVGSIFHFTIDYVMTKDEVENNAEVIVTQEITHNTLVKILIVEDDYANYQLLKTTLNRVSNCSILFAQNGLESLEVYKRNNEIDLIFMDIGLPVMNGIEAYKKLREMGYTGKVVALTAYAMAEERENINSVGFDDYISKPYTTEEIQNLLRKYSFCKH